MADHKGVFRIRQLKHMVKVNNKAKIVAMVNKKKLINCGFLKEKGCSVQNGGKKKSYLLTDNSRTLVSHYRKRGGGGLFLLNDPTKSLL